MKKEKLFILYDGRAKLGETNDASVLCTASTEKEAREDTKELFEGYDAIWFEYDVDKGDVLVNGKPRYDLPPCEDAL
jgi:hypothetical protein